MSITETKKSRIIFDSWIARIGSYTGWFWLAVWTLGGIVGLVDLFSGKTNDSVDIAMPFVSFGIASLNILLIRSSRRTKLLIQDYRLFSSVISDTGKKSVHEIAAKLKKDPEWIRERIQLMYRRGYFSGPFEFSDQKTEIDKNPAATPYITKCPGCGAANSIRESGDRCVYCGSPLKK